MSIIVVGRESDESVELIRAVREGGWTMCRVSKDRGGSVERGDASRRGRMSRFVDVNYRIVPFTRQTRSFFSPWLLIPSHPDPAPLPPSFRFTYPSIYLSSWTSLERTRSIEGTKNKTKSTYQMCGNKGRRNHGWIPRLDTFKGAQILVSRILAVATAASSFNSDAFHYVPLCSMYPPVTALLLRDEIRTRDTMAKETLVCGKMPLYLLFHLPILYCYLIYLFCMF